jgi:actin-related protein
MITEGYQYQWQCFGTSVFSLESHIEDRCSVSMIFDTRNQMVYQMEAHDYIRRRSYRWTNPDYAEKFNLEAQEKLKENDRNIAYDDVKFVDLDESKDMLTKANAIHCGQEYDTRVSVPIDLNYDELFLLMKSAHEKDITLNQLVEQILTVAINEAHRSDV